MVDFQSRDTRRGPTTDDESESESDSSADAASSEDDATGAADATGSATEGSEAEADSDSAVSEEPEAAASVAAGAETADADPLAEGYSSAAETAAERGDTAPAVSAADEASGTAGESGPAVSAADTDQPVTEAKPPAGTTATPTRAIDVAVVTVAGDRAALEDTVTTAFESAGHAVVRRERLRGGYDGIQQMVETLVGRSEVDVVVTVGGVGLSADELAIEAVHPLLEKALPGFGEAFRARLADHVGTGIVGVRSTAGVSDGTLVFCLPDDVEAAELAVSEILAAEAPKLVSQLDG